MSVAGTGVIFSLAFQKQAIMDDTFTVSEHVFYKYPTSQVELSPQQNIQMFQAEVDGKGLPKGEYKSGLAFAGGVTLTPRAKGELAWLFLAALGNIATTADTPVTGAHKHIFKFNSDVFSLPWVAARRWLPGVDAASAYGEYGWDGKVAELNFVIPATGQMVVSLNILARKVGQDHAPAWSYSNSTFPAITTSPLTNNGYIKLAGESFPVLQCSGRLMNQLSSMQDEQNVGSLYMGDVTVLSRMASVTMTINYKSGSILGRMLTNSSVDDTISPEVFKTITGTSPAFEAKFSSTDMIVGSTPHSIAIRGNAVTWKISKPPVAQAGQLMTVELTGTMVEPASGEYFEVEIINDTTAYTAPVAPTLTGATTQLAYADPWSALTIDNTLTFTSPLANLNGGTIRITTLYNGTATTDWTMTHGTIGTPDITYDGQNGVDYLIALDTDATPAAIQTALRTIAVVDSAHPVGIRRIKITVTDALGGIARYEREIKTTA